MDEKRPVRVLSSLTDSDTSVEGTDILAEFMTANGFTSTSNISFTAHTGIDLIINGDAVHMPAKSTFSWGPTNQCRSLVTVNDDEMYYFWAEF